MALHAHPVFLAVHACLTKAMAYITGVGFMENVLCRPGSVADKSSFGKPGIGMRSNVSFRRLGIDPPKNESGTTATISSSDQSSRCVSSGKGSCIADKRFPKANLERSSG